MRKTCCLFMLTCLAALPLTAAERPATLFELLTGVPSVDAGGFEVEVDLSLLRTMPERLSIPLPDGRQLVATRRGLERTSAEGFSWFGDLEGGPLAGSVSLHYYDGRVLGVVRTADGGGYRLSADGDGAHRLYEVAPAAGDTCGVTHLEWLAAPLSTASGGLENLSAALDSRLDCDAMLLKNLVLVDVMVLYPISLAGLAQQVATYAANQITESNQIMANSGVRIRYRLAHVGPITGLQPPGPTSNDATEQVLDWLNGQFFEAPDTEVELLAKAYGADMVTAVIPSHPNVNCGVANLPELMTIDQVVREVMYRSSVLFDDKAFSVVELNCGLIDFTFAHELGHTFGMRHDDEPRNSREIFPWAYGYIIADGGQGRKATVMGCVDAALPCFRVSLFSNPNLLFDGQPAGEHSPSPSQAFNACVAAERAARYGDFRHPPPSAPPTLVITSPAEGGAVPIGQAFNLVASASDPEDGNLAASVRWESDREGFLGTGSPRLVSLSLAGDHLITATVTDSSGTEVPYSIRFRVTETDPPRVWIDRPGHGEQVSGNFQVHGWATDASGVTSVSFKVDSVPVNLGSFVYGTWRSDVCTVHSDLNDPNCPKVGFRGTLNTTEMSNGSHTLQAIVKDLHGNVKIFNRYFTTSNVTTKYFVPTDDAWVNALAPATNYGAADRLEMRSHATGRGRHVYERFEVSGISRPPTEVFLNLRSSGTTTLTTCYVYRLATTSWQEETITWNNAPLDWLLNFQAWCGGSPIRIDVRSMIPGNGTYTLGLVGPDLPGQSVLSKEGGGVLFAPFLEVTY